MQREKVWVQDCTIRYCNIPLSLQDIQQGNSYSMATRILVKLDLKGSYIQAALEVTPDTTHHAYYSTARA